MKTAILIDGDFYLRRHSIHFGRERNSDPKKVACDIQAHCMKHIKKGKDQLYRIFFYDCRPLGKKAHTPIGNKAIDLSKTKLIQMVLHRIYIDKENIDTIDNKFINTVIDGILVSKDEFYKTLFEIFSTNQKKAFRLLGKYGKDLFSEKILHEENISRSSMQSSLKQLFAKEYIDKEDSTYFIPDRTFELWAKKYLS